jgi:hypothetical protein
LRDEFVFGVVKNWHRLQLPKNADGRDGSVGNFV